MASVLPFPTKMQPNSPNTLNIKRTIILSLSFTTILLAWAYFNFKVPRILEELIPEMPGKQTLKGFIMAIDNLVAVIVQPYFGDLSDRTRSRWGRRMPYIIFGTLFSCFFFALLPWIKVLVGFVLIILCFDISMSIFRSVAIAILPDYTPETVRSKASSIQQFTANMGGVIAFVIPIATGGLTQLNEDWARAIGFLIIVLIMLVLLIMQIILIKETPSGESIFEVGKEKLEVDPINLKISAILPTDSKKNETKINVYHEILELRHLPEKSYVYMLGVVFFAYTSFAAIEAFFSSFAQIYLGKADNVSAMLFLAYSVPMILTAPFWGILGQKKGRRKAAKIGLVGIIIGMSIIGFVLIPMMYNPKPIDELETTLGGLEYVFMINLAFISMMWMCFIVNSFPIIWNLAPKGNLGTYTGIYYTFNQLAYTLSPVLMGLILDAFMVWGAYQYIVMFPSILIFMILSLILMLKVQKGDGESI